MEPGETAPEFELRKVRPGEHDERDIAELAA
jgi:hypothetical protein